MYPNEPVSLLLSHTARLILRGGHFMFSKKLTRFLAVTVTAFLLGATSLHAQTPPLPPVDSDLDGIADDVDECLPSDLSPTVLINGVDTGIQNSAPNAVDCTLADLVGDMIELCLVRQRITANSLDAFRMKLTFSSAPGL